MIIAHRRPSASGCVPGVYYKGMSGEKIELGQGVWYDPETKGYIALTVTDLNPRAILIEDVLMSPKTEFHISLVPARKAAGGDTAGEAAIVDKVRQYLARNVLKYEGLTGELYICHKLKKAGETEHSVIAGVRVAGLTALRAELGLRAAIPHATVLLSANSQYGIGVNSVSDLQAYCERRDDLFPAVFPNASPVAYTA